MATIESFEEREVLFLQPPAQMRRRIEVQDSRFLGAEHCPLIQRRHEPTRPVDRTVDRRSVGVREDHVGRQLLRGATETIHDPAPHCRPARDAGNSSVEVSDRDLVPVVPRVHRADHADVIDDPRCRREQLRDLRTATAVLGEPERAAEELLVRPVDEAVNHVAGVLGPMMPGQLGLGIEQVHVRRTAVHEHRDHRRRPGSEVRRLRLEIQGQVLAGLLRRLGQQSLLAQQVSQGERPDSERRIRQECTTRRIGGISPHTKTRSRSGAVDTGL